MNTSPISWKSKKQATVSKSSSEAEYRAISSAASEVTWLVRLLEELQVDKLKPVTLHCDNQSAIHIGKNPVFHERTKHIEVDLHFTRDKVLEGLIQLTYLPTKSQLADVFTKILPSHHHHHLLSKLGMIPIPSLRGDVKTRSANAACCSSLHNSESYNEDYCNTPQHVGSCNILEECSDLSCPFLL